MDVTLYWNFRSPYCYLASKTLFDRLDRYRVNLVFRPLAGWNGRSPPDRAKKKVPLTRQDVARWCRRLGVPFNPPPISTEPTRAGCASLRAEELGLLRPYIVELMRAEWGEGKDIGDLSVIAEVARRIGAPEKELTHAAEDPKRLTQLEKNWAEAEEKGVIGVPTFVVGDELFWGNDRLDFLEEHLLELRLARL